MNLMTINELAAAAYVKISTIRYYERQNLLQEPQRSASGYRLYSSDFILQIRFIKNAQALGFTLGEIKDLLALQYNQNTSCKTIKAKTEDKIQSIDKKLFALKKIRKALKQVSDQCKGQGLISEGCPILEALGQLEPLDIIGD